MYNITSIYPKQPGCFFDVDYYLNRHMPKSISYLSKARGFRGVSVELGIDLPDGGPAVAYVAMCHYYFDTPQDFLDAFLPHADELQGDISMYTDIKPINQVSEVKIQARADS